MLPVVGSRTYDRKPWTKDGNFGGCVGTLPRVSDLNLRDSADNSDAGLLADEAVALGESVGQVSFRTEGASQSGNQSPISLSTASDRYRFTKNRPLLTTYGRSHEVGRTMGSVIADETSEPLRKVWSLRLYSSFYLPKQTARF
jgi:hypothetical protein